MAYTHRTRSHHIARQQRNVPVRYRALRPPPWLRRWLQRSWLQHLQPQLLQRQTWMIRRVLLESWWLLKLAQSLIQKKVSRKCCNHSLVSELEYSGQDSLESDTQGECSEILVSDTHIVDANESSIYLLFPTGNVYIKASNRSTIVLGAVAGNLTLEGCENCTIVAATHCMQIMYVHDLCHIFLLFSSCRKLQLNLLVNTPPILLGDNSHLTFGPYNTHYACLEPHLAVRAFLMLHLPVLSSPPSMSTITSTKNRFCTPNTWSSSSQYSWKSTREPG